MVHYYQYENKKYLNFC